MNNDMIIDYDYIAKNIDAYIDQGNFYDIFDEDVISEVVKKATLKSKDFELMVSQGKSKFNSVKLYEMTYKSNVVVHSYDDAIQILKSYKDYLGLESSNSLITFFEQYKEDHISDTKEVQELKTEIQNLQKKVRIMENEIKKLKDDNIELTKCKKRDYFNVSTSRF